MSSSSSTAATNPLAGPLRSRDELARAAVDLVAALEPYRSAGCARVRLGATGAAFATAAAELEGFARPLWALASLAAGGFAWDGWDRVRAGLVAGCSPGHPEFWGWADDRDQRLVEMAAIGFALAIAPDQVWTPLSPHERATVERWLCRINERQPHDNNWLFFRVVVNLGLKRVGARHDPALVEQALARLESFHLGGGWYRDGPADRMDWYNAFGMQTYGLLYAKLAGPDDPARADRFRERATVFARDLRHWFDEEGAAIPFGRSMTYRFAQAGFWSTLAFADCEALPWGEIKGLMLRNLRWWSRWPIADRDGVLSIGYAYPNLLMSEEYNSPGSPYWAMKAFVALALPADHAFWSCEEEPSAAREAVSVQRPARLAIARNATHAVALCAGQQAVLTRGAAAKYAKFAYSSRFAFSVESDGRGLDRGAFDSMLALSIDGDLWRPRGDTGDHHVSDDGVVRSSWSPFPGVFVTTLLAHAGDWHLRLHRIESDLALLSAEGGFALDRGDADRPDEAWTGEGGAFATSLAGFSGLSDCSGDRIGEVVRALPNTNLIAARTVIPTLRGTHAAGITVLRTAVLADAFAERGRTAFANAPQFPASLAMEA